MAFDPGLDVIETMVRLRHDVAQPDHRYGS
jgi:hypothetical protein